MKQNINKAVSSHLKNSNNFINVDDLKDNIFKSQHLTNEHKVKFDHILNEFVKEAEKNKKLNRGYGHNYTFGTKVEIIGNIPLQLKNNPRPIYATVMGVDGMYISVKPKNKQYMCEFYPTEIKKVSKEEFRGLTLNQKG